MSGTWTHQTVRIDGETFPLSVRTPEGSPPADGWPVILSLHGAGERGSDGLRQTKTGLGPAIAEQPDRFPARVLFPQAPEGSWWKGRAARAVLHAVYETLDDPECDRRRVYAVGLSMGGYGVLDMAMREPDLFAAIVCICGGVVAPSVFPGMSADLAGDEPYETAIDRLQGVPVWLWHGEHDPIIPVTESRRLKQAGDRLGSMVRYTELAGCGHNAWDPAFREPELWRWLLEQRRDFSVRAPLVENHERRG